MADFINTVDVLGDDTVTDSIITRSITEYHDDNVTSIGYNAFAYCPLTSIDCPNVTSTDYGAFYGCSNLTSVNLPSLTTVGESTFRKCSMLESVTLPNASKFNGYAFGGCTELTSVDLPVATSFGFDAFNTCSALATLILRNTAQVATTSSSLNSTPIKSGTGYIYVPRDLVDSYKAATNWSTYAAQFRALEDYTVDGTTTGELDPTKI